MSEHNPIYLCRGTGTVVELLGPGGGTLMCGAEPMVKLEEKAADKTVEKHVPVIERKADGYLVKVGTVAHPMLDKHYIQWIELQADGLLLRAMLDPGQPPEAFFPIPEAKSLSAREYCNLHGLWRG